MRWRRRVDLAALTTLVLGVPWVVLSLFIVVLMGLVAGEGYVLWIALAWLLSGSVLVLPPTESVLAKAMFRLRRPVVGEREHLQVAWQRVLAAAGVSRSRYQLWVQDSEEVNAYATGGHIVAVTGRALRSLQPRQLEAVLAHELGHHLGGHAWASLVIHWYSIPARLAWRLIRWLTRLGLGVISVFSTAGYLTGLVVILLAGVSYLMMALQAITMRDYFQAFVLLGPLFAPVIVVWFGRRAELAADRIAVGLGYGPDLLLVLEQWQREGHDEAVRRAVWHRRILATHPLVATRIGAVKRHLESGASRV